MRPIRILFVDDNVEFLNAATHFLSQKAGIEIVGKIYCSRNAKNQAEAHKPDLVLIDLMMPDLDGLETTRLLKQIPDPPAVIVLSLYDDPSFRDAALDAGAEGFLTKRLFSKQLMPFLDNMFPDLPDHRAA